VSSLSINAVVIVAFASMNAYTYCTFGADVDGGGRALVSARVAL
jgi:hypothetical protein